MLWAMREEPEARVLLARQLGLLRAKLVALGLWVQRLEPLGLALAVFVQTMGQTPHRRWPAEHLGSRGCHSFQEATWRAVSLVRADPVAVARDSRLPLDPIRLE